MIGVIANCTLAVTAIVAAVYSRNQIKSYKQKENNKLLSQLNNRYLGSESIQKVIKYLRDFDAEDDKPSSYEVEVFLRFFEELGVYMRKDDLPAKDVKEFFNYYFEKFFTSERGKELRKQIKDGDQKLQYLDAYKKKLGLKY